jgi:membrane protein YdbS with pleckstrin-like domain
LIIVITFFPDTAHTMENVPELLRQVELFRDVEQRNLIQITALFERILFDRDDYLIHQGEPGTRFYLLESGRASMWHTDSAGARHRVRQLEPGDYFGISSLFYQDIRDTTVRVAEGSTFLSLERSRFLDYLKAHPQVRKALTIPAQVRERLDAPRFKWMTPDEFTVFFATKTRWALLPAELLPVAILTVFVVAAALLHRWLLAIPGPVVAVPLALLKWQDWRNDHYVVTNKRVAHHESRLLTLQVQVHQAPLHRIQNVTALKLNPLAQMLNFGTLVIETAGSEGSIAFRHLSNPARCQEIIFDQIEKSQAIAMASEQAAIRQAITEQVHPGETSALEIESLEQSAPERILYTSGEVVWDMGAAPQPEQQPSSEEPPSSVRFRRILSLFVPRFRVEKNGIVTWFKHPFVLIRQTWKPLLLVVLTMAGAIYWAVAGGKGPDLIILALLVVWCIGLLWLFWQYEDWHNDIFQMTATHLIDIDRLPLGFRESRRQAPLEQVQNINAVIPNLWARLFNYGNVIIETVQAEIFGRIENMRKQRQAEEQKRKSEEMARWFSVYHRMKEEREI